jgi:hypothetical protein
MQSAEQELARAARRYNDGGRSYRRAFDRRNRPRGYYPASVGPCASAALHRRGSHTGLLREGAVSQGGTHLPETEIANALSRALGVGPNTPGFDGVLARMQNAPRATLANLDGDGFRILALQSGGAELIKTQEDNARRKQERRNDPTAAAGAPADAFDLAQVCACGVGIYRRQRRNFFMRGRTARRAVKIMGHQIARPKIRQPHQKPAEGSFLILCGGR